MKRSYNTHMVYYIGNIMGDYCAHTVLFAINSKAMPESFLDKLAKKWERQFDTPYKAGDSLTIGAGQYEYLSNILPIVTL